MVESSQIVRRRAWKSDAQLGSPMSPKARSMKITLPVAWRTLMRRKIRRDGFLSTGEYVRFLIRRDLALGAVMVHVDALITELACSPRELVAAGWWTERHAELPRPRRRQAKITHNRS